MDSAAQPRRSVLRVRAHQISWGGRQGRQHCPLLRPVPQPVGRIFCAGLLQAPTAIPSLPQPLERLLQGSIEGLMGGAVPIQQKIWHETPQTRKSCTATAFDGIGVAQGRPAYLQGRFFAQKGRKCPAYLSGCSEARM